MHVAQTGIMSASTSSDRIVTGRAGRAERLEAPSSLEPEDDPEPTAHPSVGTVHSPLICRFHALVAFSVYSGGGTACHSGLRLSL